MHSSLFSVKTLVLLLLTVYWSLSCDRKQTQHQSYRLIISPPKLQTKHSDASKNVDFLLIQNRNLIRALPVMKEVFHLHGSSAETKPQIHLELVNSYLLFHLYLCFYSLLKDMLQSGHPTCSSTFLPTYGQNNKMATALTPDLSVQNSDLI